MSIQNSVRFQKTSDKIVQYVKSGDQMSGCFDMIRQYFDRLIGIWRKIVYNKNQDCLRAKTVRLEGAGRERALLNTGWRYI